MGAAKTAIRRDPEKRKMKGKKMRDIALVSVHNRKRKIIGYVIFKLGSKPFKSHVYCWWPIVRFRDFTLDD